MRPRPAQKSIYLLVFYFVISSLFLFLDSRGSLGGLHIVGQRVTTPLEERLYGGKTEVLGRFGGLGRLGKEEKNTQYLEERIAFLEGQIGQMGALREENERMRYLLGAGLSANWRFEPLRVFSIYADLVNVGGIGEIGGMRGKIVIATEGKGGIYVGRVEKVVGQQAEVFLPTKDGEKIPVRVRNRDTGEVRASGILVGRGEDMIIDQVLTGEVLEEGDLVLTAGDERGVPPELLIGYVARILPVTGAFQQAEMTQAIDYRKLQVIFVVTKF